MHIFLFTIPPICFDLFAVPPICFDLQNLKMSIWIFTHLRWQYTNQSPPSKEWMLSFPADGSLWSRKIPVLRRLFEHFPTELGNSLLVHNPGNSAATSAIRIRQRKKHKQLGDPPITARVNSTFITKNNFTLFWAGGIPETSYLAVKLPSWDIKSCRSTQSIEIQPNRFACVQLTLPLAATPAG